VLSATLSPTMTTSSTTPTPSTPTTSRTASALRTSVITKVGVTPPTFSCANNVCTGTGATDFVFRTFQGLINMALAQLGKVGFVKVTVSIPVNGKIDSTVVNAFLPISRAVGGTLAFIDVTPTPQMLAQNAAAYAQGIAQWLGVTWIEATATVPGHWERLRAGQTSMLPQPPTASPSDGRLTTSTQPAPTSLCPPGMVATSHGCIMTAPPPPDQTQPSQPAPQQTTTTSSQPQPTSTTPPPPTVTLCPPGTIATSQGCLATQPSEPPPKPQPQPQPQPSTLPSDFVPEAQVFKTCPDGSQVMAFQACPSVAKQRYAGCIARFNRTRRVFSIYCPISSPAAGLGRAGTYPSYNGLGADTVTPPPPAGFVKTAEVATLPGAGETAAGEESDKFFRANNPMMWLTIVGTLAVVGGGGYFLLRRRKTAAKAAFGHDRDFFELDGP